MADLTSLTDDQLEALMKNPEAAAPKEEAEPKAPEPPPEEPPPTEEPPPAEPEPPAPEPEPQEDLEKARLQAVIEEMEARQRATESKLGRFAGEADFWRRKAEAVRPEPQADDRSYAEPEPTEPRPQPRQADSITQWAISQAIAAGEADFRRDHSDFSGDAEKEVMQQVASMNIDASRFFGDGNPMAAQKEAYRVLDEAYWQVRASRAAKARIDIEQKRTEQFARQKEAKVRSTSSGSGGTQAPKPVAKTLQQFTDAELDAEMRRLTIG